MRGEHDLYQPKDGAECEHLEFKCHGYPDADCDRTRYHRLEPTAERRQLRGRCWAPASTSRGRRRAWRRLQPDQRARHPVDEAFEVDLVAQAIVIARATLAPYSCSISVGAQNLRDSLRSGQIGWATG